MGLPSSPTFSFKIPSIHDGTQLSCRLYVPPQLQQSETASSWQKRGAIVAHPYAPLGGCFDDPVVSTVGGELLESGYVVGTFNFRGAGDSEGKTSWTAKPELADYVSFYGFMFYFLNALKAGVSPSQRQRPNQSQTSPVDVGDDESGKTHTTLDIILSGYSYGSMIASHVPTVDTVLKLFQEAPKDSFAAAARSRAEQCSAHCNDYTQAAPRPQTPELPRPGSSPRSPLPVVLGQSPASPKGRKTSLEGVRRSIDQAKRKISFGSRSSDVGSREPRRDTMAKLEIPTPRISYLLVSPILPPISQFLTMFSKISLSSNASSGTSAQGTPIPSPVPEQQLCAHPTLAIYGDNDTFTPAHKLEKWCDDIANMAESKFQHREIEDAGHFWHEHGARTQMKATIRTWIDRLHRDNENI